MAKKSDDLQSYLKNKKITRRDYIQTGFEFDHSVGEDANFEEEVVSESELVNGILQKKLSLKKVDVRERNKGLNYWDFSIDSLAASGAIADLKFSSLSGDRMNVVDALGSQVDNMPVQTEEIQTEEIDNKNIEG